MRDSRRVSHLPDAGALCGWSAHGEFETACSSDFWAASAVPGADEAWAIGSHGQLFHYAAGKVTRYETGAPCA